MEVGTEWRNGGKVEGRRERFQFLQQARVSDRYTLAMREKVRRELRHILPHPPKAQGTLALGGKPGLSRARLSYSEHWPFRFHGQNCRTHTDNDIPQKLLPEQLTIDVFFFAMVLDQESKKINAVS